MTINPKTCFARLLLFLGCMPMLACASEYDLIPINDPPELCAEACQPRRMSSWINASGQAEMAGYAVEIAAWGYETPEAIEYGDFSATPLAGYTVKKHNRTSVSGAPYATVSGSARGRIHLLRAGIFDGELANVTPTPIDGPFGRTVEFGYALLAADVREGRTREISQFGANNPPTGYGEEIIVGAPGTNDDTGEIYWYENLGSFTRPWQYGEAYVPSTAAGGDRFGSAIAAPHDHDARYPNDNTTVVPDWIAVGAPGGSTVYILDVDETLSQPFSIRQRLTGPTGSSYGAAISIADFNKDGIDDIAIGAPTTAGGGRVYIYAGDSGRSPFSIRDDLIVSSSIGGGEFGYSLASGSVNRDDLYRPLLVVGAPSVDQGTNTDAGAVCQFQFEGGSPMTVLFERCDRDSSPSFGERYGHSVAVGNFIATNSGGETWDTCALSEEVAVGAPYAIKTENGLPVAVAAGFVKILAQGATGAEPSEPATNTFWGSTDFQYTGFSLVADHVQRNDHEDLLIGAPYRDLAQGSISLTRAELPGSEDDDISGIWRGQDADGNDFDLRVHWSGSELTISMLDDAAIRATRTGGACRVLFYDVDFDGTIPFAPIPWPTAGVDHTERVTLDISAEVGLPAEIEADLSYDASSHTFTMNVDEDEGIISSMNNDCRVDNFVFEQTMALVCD